MVDRCDVVRVEVPTFLAYAPTAADLAGLADVGLVATVGSASPDFRQRAAAVLGQRSGARVEVLDGVCHLPQREAPEASEKVIRSAAGGPSPGRIRSRPIATRW